MTSQQSALSPSPQFQDAEEVITIRTSLIPKYSTDWDAGLTETPHIKSTKEPQTINLFETSSGNESTFADFNDSTITQKNETPSYKKWHILKLREKLTYLKMNDRGNRSELIKRLDDYYLTLPNRINNAINPWINDNLNDILHDSQQEDQKAKEHQHQEKSDHSESANTNLLPSLLVEIVKILEIICQPLLNDEKSSSQIKPNTTPAIQQLPKQVPKWQKAGKPFGKHDSGTKEIKLSNRFKPFENQNEQNKPLMPNKKDDIRSNSKGTTTARNTTRRKPNICETAKYVDNMNVGLPIKPGHKSYAKTASNASTIALVSDSMCRSIRNNAINSFIDNNVEVIKISKFPGAHSNQIQHYSKWTIENDEPDSLVVVSGTNDINYSDHPSVEQISKKILDIARQAKRMGIENIFVCGITCRKNDKDIGTIRDINLALRLVSADEGFNFIDNENILKSDLNRDGLHLNPSGTDKLMRNILQHTCTTY